MFKQFSSVAAGAVLLGGTMMVVSAEPAAALMLGSSFNVKSHPGGGKAPPVYCLRLDGLLSGKSSEIYTFDCNHDQSNVMLTYDETGVRIMGQVFGGKDIGVSYKAGTTALWDLDFRYEFADITPMDGGIRVSDGIADKSLGNGTGTLTSTEFGEFLLADYSGNFGYTFDFKPDGHRIDPGNPAHAPYDENTWVGRGWLNHEHVSTGTLNAGDLAGTDINKHLSASDWLFVAEPKRRVPEPGFTLGLFSLGLWGASSLLKRNRKNG